MLRSEIVLQCFFIVLTAGIFSLLVVKAYPSFLIKQYTANASTPIPTIVKTQKSADEKVYSPVVISVPSIKLSLSIAPGTIENDNWTLYDDKVSWLYTSKTIGEGNVILYAHNKDNLFGGLKTATIGAEVLLKDDAGQSHIYEIVEKRKVTPSDTQAILSERNQLTLYTCDGVFDQKRLIVVALPRD